MRTLRLSHYAVAISTLVITQFSYASAFQFYELGAPINGTAGVGQAALTNNASIAYYNPAGMSQLPNSELLLGTQLMLPYTNFSASASNTIVGSNGGNAGSLIPGADGFFVYHYSPKINLGVSLTTPYGGALNYNNRWVGRFYVQQMLMYTMNLNPALSYQINDWAAIGAGVAIEYANLNQTIAIPVTPDIAGQATVKVANTAPGFNLGVLLSPNPTTSIGVAYRSQIVHHLSGNINFLNITTSPKTNTTLTMPHNIIASLSERLSNQFTLLAEVGWANWASMKNTITTVEGYTSVIPENWHDTYRLGLGGHYFISPDLLLQAGVAYDSSPTSTSHRLPVLPMDRQIRVGLGLQYAIVKAANLGLSYEYINLGTAPINNVSSNGVLAGSYSRNDANVLQASLNVDC